MQATMNVKLVNIATNIGVLKFQFCRLVLSTLERSEGAADASENNHQNTCSSVFL